MHNLRCCLNHFRKQELNNEVRRVNSIDNGIFIHAIVPRHVETVVCLSKENANLKDYVEIGVDAVDYYNIKSAEKDV
jgi:hypothetical protein